MSAPAGGGRTVSVAQADVDYAPQHVLAPGPLGGVIRLQGADGGPPTPLASAFVQFYFVTSDPSGERVAFPVASAVTDDQGNWSAPGPPTE